jgi:uncharacterized protein
MIGKSKRRWKGPASVVICALLLVALGSWIAGGLLCKRSNSSVSAPADLVLEKVSFKSLNGETIHGWLSVPATNRAVIILQHGIRANRLEMLARARFLLQNDYSVLLYDFQAHGESTGERITFGFLESRDAHAAVDFVQQRFPGKSIGVIGVSLGAAAAALADPPLKAQALVLESMFPSIIDATQDRIEMRFGAPGRCLSPLLTCQLKSRTGCGVNDLRPIEKVGMILAPKLFLAGTEDRETKLSEAKAIFAKACEPKSFVPFEGARHQDLHRFAAQKYEKLILSFFEEHLE